MQRVRRLSSVVSLVLVGILAVSACGRSAPDVAVYVGDKRISADQVEQIYDEAQARYRTAVESEARQADISPSPDQLRSAVTRQDVVNLLVGLDLGRRVAEAKQIDVPDQYQADRVAGLIRMPPDTEYARLWAEWLDIYTALGGKLSPAELSDDSVLAVYQSLVKAGAIDPGLPIQQVRQLFGTGEFVQRDTAISEALAEEAKRLDVSVNPRFLPLAVPGVVAGPNGTIFYELPYVDGAGPVTELAPSTAPTSAAPRQP
ncbi:SurA N-terminal domain-containing protein [Plantactinospora sp. GCM10030261]|uniref:SurA N-terminal domain-containing protein n=1 Tax=Plantactinospora sp. GCM10030261 TaxID=3273420 RepID=UPI00361914B0